MIMILVVVIFVVVVVVLLLLLLIIIIIIVLHPAFPSSILGINFKFFPGFGIRRNDGTAQSLISAADYACVKSLHRHMLRP